MSHLAPHLHSSPFPFFFFPLSILSVLRFLSELLELIFWVNEHLAEKDLLCSRNHSSPRWKQPSKRPPSQKCFEILLQILCQQTATSVHIFLWHFCFWIKCCLHTCKLLFTAGLPALTTQEERQLCTRLRNQDSSPSHAYEWVFSQGKTENYRSLPTVHQSTRRHKHPVWPPQTSPQPPTWSQGQSSHLATRPGLTTSQHVSEVPVQWLDAWAKPRSHFCGFCGCRKPSSHPIVFQGYFVLWGFII